MINSLRRCSPGLLALLVLAACGGGGGGGGGLGGPSVFPRFAYVTNSDDDSLSIYTIDPLRGQLRPHGYALTGDAPDAVQADPSGRFLYVANSGGDDISAFRIDAASGRLAPVGAFGPAGDDPQELAVDPSGRFLYAVARASNEVRAFAIDAVSGALTPIGGGVAAGDSPRDLAIDPLGRFLYVASFDTNAVLVFAIDVVTGALTTAPVSAPVVTGPTDLAMAPDGRFLHVVDPQGSLIHRFGRDLVTGALTLAGTLTAAAVLPGDLTIHPSGAFAYQVAESSDSVQAFAIDGSSGALSALASPLSTANSPRAVAVDPSGQLLFVVADAFTVDGFRIGSGVGTLARLTTSPTVATRGRSRSMEIVGGASAVRHTARFAYVAERTAGDVRRFSVHPTSGALSEVGTPLVTGAFPHAIAVEPLGRFAFLARDFSDEVRVYAVDAGTGALTDTGQFFLGFTPFQLLPDPTGRFLFVLEDDNVRTLSIDPVSGALESEGNATLPAPATGARRMALDPQGLYLAVTDASGHVFGHRVDAVTGVLSSIGGIDLSTDPRGIQFHPCGHLAYVASSSTDQVEVRIVGRQLGAQVITSASTGPVDVAEVALDPSGRFLFALDLLTDAVTPFRIAPFQGLVVTSGELTSAGTAVTAGSRPVFLAADPSGRFIYTANALGNSISSFAISDATGALTPIGPALAVGAEPVAIAFLVQTE